MRINLKIAATALAAAIATSSMSAPAAAFAPGFFFFKPFYFKPVFKPPFKIIKYVKPPKPPHVSPTGGKGGTGSTSMTTGKIVVGCLFGSALGLIAASLAKGKAMNDRNVELTQQEAWTIAMSCGLGTFPVVANFQRNG